MVPNRAKHHNIHKCTVFSYKVPAASLYQPMTQMPPHFSTCCWLVVLNLSCSISWLYLLILGCHKVILMLSYTEPSECCVVERFSALNVLPSNKYLLLHLQLCQLQFHYSHMFRFIQFLIIVFILTTSAFFSCTLVVTFISWIWHTRKTIPPFLIEITGNLALKRHLNVSNLWSFPFYFLKLY